MVDRQSIRRRYRKGEGEGPEDLRTAGTVGVLCGIADSSWLRVVEGAGSSK